MKRNHFLQAVGATGLLVATGSLTAATLAQRNDPQLDKELVATFVGAGHSDMDTVKALLEEHPTLLNAAHDWKFGDFETALGAASHVGYKDLAQYLIDKGAQTNIFSAALFGKLEIVKLTIETFPSTLHAKGPHGFTLLHHAIKGGAEAEGVAEYLRSMGAEATKIALY
jgi:ankyrin repeat protein